MAPTFYVMKTKANRLADSLHATDCPSMNPDHESLTKSEHSDFVRVFLLLKFKSSNPNDLHQTVFLFWSSGHGQQQVVPSPVSATSPPASKPQPQNGSSGMGKARHSHRRLRADYKCQAFE